MSEDTQASQTQDPERDSTTQNTNQSDKPERRPVKRIVAVAAGLLFVGGTVGFFLQENAKHESFRHLVREYVAHTTVGNLELQSLGAELDYLEKITSPENQRFLSSEFSRDKETILIKALGLSPKFYSASGVASEARDKIRELDGYIAACRNQLGELPRNVRTFLIYRQFDTTSNGDGVFEATQMSNYMKCVLVAEPNHIDVFAPNTVRLLADDIGKQPYAMTRFNAFQNFQTTDYFDTFRVKSYEKESRSIRELLSSHEIKRFEASRDVANADTEMKAVASSLRQIGEILARY